MAKEKLMMIIKNSTYNTPANLEAAAAKEMIRVFEAFAGIGAQRTALKKKEN